jgi:hypothetical protein
MKRWTVVIAVMVAVGVGRDAVCQGPSVLAGVDSVDARVLLTWDDDIDRLSEETVRSRLQTVLELTLRQNDIKIAPSARNYLEVSFVVLDDGSGGVAYSYGIDLVEPVYTERAVARWINGAAEAPGGPWAKLMAHMAASEPTWVSSWAASRGVGHVGRNNLEDALETNVRQMAEEFVNQRLAASGR